MGGGGVTKGNEGGAGGSMIGRAGRGTEQSRGGRTLRGLATKFCKKSSADSGAILRMYANS